MSFINPIFLLGLLGITLPIIIHMMGRRHAPTYKFSAIEFILRSQKKVAARLKLEQLLLLLLRVAILALIATALAKPVLTAGPVLAPDTPSCNIIIMDNSYSMGYVIAGKTLLERAKGWAKDFVGTLSPADEGCVITIFPTAEDPPKATADKSEIVDAIDRVAQSYYNTDIPPLLDTALSILNASTKRIKRIFLFTDLTKNGWASEGMLGMQKRLKDSQARLHLIDISEGKPQPNVAVSGLEHEYDWTRKDKELLLKATISNYTDAPVEDFLVKARIGEEDVAQGFIQIEPGRSATKEFLLDASASKNGMAWGSVQIPDDPLSVDNRRYFTLPMVGEIRVLVIDGAPSINLYQSATFYLEKALNPARFHTSHIDVTVMNTKEVQKADFNDYDLIILANVERLDGTKTSELKTYVSEGGNVFFSLGNRVKPEYYNATFAGLVPRLRMAVESPEERPLEFAQLDTVHILLKVFAGERKDVLSTPVFYKVFLVEPEMYGDTNCIISYSNGAPALIEMSYGQGRSLTLTSTINRDWTDLPVKPIFLPLVQQICRYMTGNLIEAVAKDVLVGEQNELPFQDSGKAEGVEVLDPRGNLVKPVADRLAPGSPLIVAETHFPGVYRVRSGDARMSFAVNVDPKEGNLSKVDKNRLEGILGREKVSFRVSSPVKGAEGTVEGKGLWPTLLFAALCLMSVEAFVSWRRL